MFLILRNTGIRSPKFFIIKVIIMIENCVGALNPTKRKMI